MKSIVYFLLISWCRYFIDITWKEMIQGIISSFIIFARIALKFIAILVVIMIAGPLLAIYAILALSIGPCMWLFEKMFPDSPLFYQKKCRTVSRMNFLKLVFRPNV